MEFDLFKKENKVIQQAKSLLEHDNNDFPPKTREEFETLLNEYQKLFKNSKRLIKLADRNEQQLRDSSREIAEQKEELERRQKDLVQAEKLASLGRLVAGVAHELNTPLGIILTSASCLQSDTKHLNDLISSAKAKKSDVARYMVTALEACALLEHHSQSAADLITSFKAVSVDRAGDEKRKFELGQYVQDIIRSLLPSINTSHIQVSCYQDDPIEIYSYPGPLNQVLSNLILNAHKHGFEDGSIAGEINIYLKRTEDCIEIRVSDTGKGIDGSVLETLFDPFVTTARDSGGTGLGLNITYNIVTGKFNGRISADCNKDGKGACFIVSLPIWVKET